MTRTRVAFALSLSLSLLCVAAIVTGGALLWTRADTAEEPLNYTVVRGDTLFEIAEAHGVTVADLRSWNTLEGDLIEVDQVLQIWPSNPSTPASQTAASTSRSRRAQSPSPPARSADASFTMPTPKTCLEGPALRPGGDDEQMVASAGLSPAQVRDAMNHFVGHTLTCIAESETPPEAPLLMEITAGCDGRVSKIAVLDAGDWSSEMATCVTTVLGFTPFPAHDLPGGETFQYPLTYTAG